MKTSEQNMHEQSYKSKNLHILQDSDTKLWYTIENTIKRGNPR